MKLFYFVVGMIAMALGGVGVLLPVLPTTPFLLLAAFCFAKSSKRFHLWFTTSKLYKNHLESFITHRSMTIKTKATLLIFASTMLLIAMIVMNHFWLRLFIVFLILFKYYYFFFCIKTIESLPQSS